MRSMILTIATGIIILVGWEVLPRWGWVDPALLPTASEVVIALGVMVSDVDFYRHASATLMLMMKGFALAFVVGVPLGVIMGLNRTVDNSMSFYVDFLRTLPAAALIPMFMVLFPGEIARILVIALAGALIFVVACRSGVRNVEQTRADILTILRVSPLGRFRKLLFWEMLSELFVGARVAISFTFILATVLEMLLGARYGLGDLLLNAQPTDKPKMYAVILVLGLIGYVLNLAFRLAEYGLRRMGLFQTQ